MTFPVRSHLLWIVLAFAIVAAAAGAQEAPPPPPLPVENGDLTQPSSRVAIVLDTARDNKNHLSEVEKPVATFVRRIGDGSRFGLMTAGGTPELLQDDLSTSGSDVLGRLDNIRASGQLALYDAIASAADLLRRTPGDDNRAVVVFTAGADAASRLNAAGLQAELNREPRIPVFILAGPGTSWRAQQVLQEIAQATGGAAYFPARNDDMKVVAQSLAARFAPFSAATVSVNNSRPGAARPLSAYASVVVRGVGVARTRATAGLFGGENELLRRVLIARLRRQKIFSQVRDRSSGEGGQAEVLASIVGFEHGSRLKRALLPVGGAIKLRVNVVVRDAASQRPLLSFAEEGVGSTGPFGGSDERVESAAILDAVDKVVDRLRAAR